MQTRLSAWCQHLPHICRKWCICQQVFVCVCARLCVLLLSSSHAYFFVGKLVCVSSSTVWQVRGCVWACTGACVHNQVCLCTGIFCVIPALLLSLAQDYYSVSDLLLPFFFISIFSLCFFFFYLFYSAIFLMNTYMIFCFYPPLVLVLLLFLLNI